MSTTPDAVAPPPRHPRFPLMDGMRALAVLCVVVVHVTTSLGLGDSLGDRFLVHLNLGVTIFFLISGFLLYRPFIAHRAGGPGAPRLGDYGKRRLLRIIPAYWLVITALLLLPGVTASSGDSLIPQYGLFFTLIGADGWTCADCGLQQTWSLVVEATFYLALPLYVIGAGRLARRRGADWVRYELAFLAGLALGSMLLHFLIYDGVPPSLIGGSLLSFGLWFCLGMALAVVSVSLDLPGREPAALRAVRSRPGLMWLIALALYVTVSLILPATTFVPSVGEQLVGFVGLALVAFFLLIPAALPLADRGPVQGFLASAPMAWLGLISYGIFLWHIAVLNKLTDVTDGWGTPALLIATLAITVAVAAASYYALERPLLKFKYAGRGGEASTAEGGFRAPRPPVAPRG